MDLTIETLGRKIDEVCKSIPFGMSDFQMEQMVVNKVSPYRSARQIIAEMNKRYGALKEAEFRKKKFNAEVELLKRQARSWFISKEQRCIIEVDIEIKFHNAHQEEKLIQDAIIEVNNLLQMLEKMPKFNREQFEKNERKYWTDELLLQARREFLATGRVGAGTLEVLEQLGHKPTQIFFEVAHSVKSSIKALEEAAKKMLQEKGETIESGNDTMSDPGAGTSNTEIRGEA